VNMFKEPNPQDHEFSIRKVNDYGTQYWYLNDKLHRENDLPAIITYDGAQHWYLNGVLHRENDLPAIIRSNGAQYWWLNNKLIRSENV